MKILKGFLAFTLTMFCCVLPQLGHTADYTVNVFDDPTPMNDPSPNINGCVSPSINGGRCSLREAVLAANVNGGPSSTITLPAGDYQLTITGSNEESGLTGDLDILNHPLTIQGAGANVTSINASTLADRIFDIPTTGVVEVNVNALTLTGGNTATSTLNAGGAISILSVASADTLNINECNIVANSSNLGGGVRATSANLNIADSTIANNTSTDLGGGIVVGNSTLNISNSTLSGNTAVGSGGGVALIFATAVFRSSTIYNNQTEATGGGVNLGFAIGSFENVILSGNTAASGSGDCYGGPTGTSDDYNIFGAVTDCGGLVLGTHDQTVATADLGLLPLENYGGPTLTHQLESTSPAINAGSPTICPDTSGTPLTTDQRGQVRPIGANCDVGAVELGTADLTITNTASTENAAIGASIVNTIVVSNAGPDKNFNIVMTDTLPTSLVSFSSVSSSNPSVSCAESSGVVTCSLSELASGASFTVLVTSTATTAGSASNSAAVQGTEIDSSPDVSAVELIVGASSGGGCSLVSSLPMESMLPYLFVALGFLVGLRMQNKSRKIKL